MQIASCFFSQLMQRRNVGQAHLILNRRQVRTGQCQAPALGDLHVMQ